LIAILLKKALPPIVKAAVKAVITSPVYNTLVFNFSDREVDIVTPAEPDTIPHISPITSLQNDDTLSAFFLNDTAFMALLISVIVTIITVYNGFISITNRSTLIHHFNIINTLNLCWSIR
jgi:hypothetical protein